MVWFEVKLFVTIVVLNSLALSRQVPFRDAHGISGKAVFLAESKSIPLNQLTVEDLRTAR